MSANIVDLEVRRQTSSLDTVLQGNELQAQLAGQSMIGACYGVYGYYVQCSPPPSLSDFELRITQFNPDKEPCLDYGPKLRLLMAEPFKGVDLREAIAKLKIALKEAIQ